MKKTLHQFIEDLSIVTISNDRKADFSPLINFILKKRKENLPIQLNFICTHNSRRSQLSQLWAKVMAAHHNIEVATYSGGVEITACNEGVINALTAQGFHIHKSSTGGNPIYLIGWGEASFGEYFSKLFDHVTNPKENFAAIMTCAHADENCPYISGAEQRIILRYEDPKRFDGTENEASAYLDKSMEIAAEMYHIFSVVKEKTTL